MQYSINALIALTMVLATSVEAKKGLHGKGFTGDGVLGAGADFAGGVVGGVLGGVVARRGIHERRQMDPLDSVPQYNYDMCRESLNGAKLSFTPGALAASRSPVFLRLAWFSRPSSPVASMLVTLLPWVQTLSSSPVLRTRS